MEGTEPPPQAAQWGLKHCFCHRPMLDYHYSLCSARECSGFLEELRTRLFDSQCCLFSVFQCYGLKQWSLDWGRQLLPEQWQNIGKEKQIVIVHYYPVFSHLTISPHFSAMAMGYPFWNFCERLTNLLFPVHVVKEPSSIASSVAYKHFPFSVYLVQFYNSKIGDLISIPVSPIQKAVCSLF